MKKHMLNKDIYIDVDPLDGYLFTDGEVSLIQFDTDNESCKSVVMDPKQARNMGKQLVAFADTYDARVAKAKERSKAIKAKKR
jgi:hypothetical protein